MTKLVHCKKEEYDIYIGRPSIYGNPFSHKKGSQAQVLVTNREEAVRKYEQWIQEEIEVDGIEPPTIEQILELKGKILGCWCHPHLCHGSVLVEICDGPKLSIETNRILSPIQQRLDYWMNCDGEVVDETYQLICKDLPEIIKLLKRRDQELSLQLKLLKYTEHQKNCVDHPENPDLDQCFCGLNWLLDYHKFLLR